MFNRIKIFYYFIGLVSISSPLLCDCTSEADFRTWITEGNAAYGNWMPSADGLSVTQMLDTMPTFFVNNQEMINVKITGELSIESSAGDDFVGIVFGYRQPSSVNQGNSYDFWLISWKKAYENYKDNIAQEGLSLAKVNGSIEDNPGQYYNTFWEQKDTDFFQILATKWNLGNGWKNMRKYKFQLIYTTTKIVFILDKDTVFNEGGCFVQGRFGLFSFKQKNVKFSNINYELASDFNPIPPQACKGESILFRATCSIIPTNIVSWEWDFGDGNTSTEVNPEYTYKDAGLYDVSLKITDIEGCTSKTIIKIRVYNPPQPVVAGKVKTCAGSLDTYEGLSDPDIRQLWQVTGGEISGSAEDWNCRIKWGEAGQGRIMLLQTDRKTGCKGQAYVDVEINKTPKIIAGKDAVLCQGEPYRLFCEASGGSGNPDNFLYEWFPPDGLDNPNSKTPVASFAEPGFYALEARVTDSLGCIAGAVVRLTVRENPILKSEPDTVSFGALLGCNRFIDTLVKVKNPSKYGIRITGVFPADVFNLGGIVPKQINPDDSAYVKIRFQPERDGIYSDSILLVYEPCGDTLKIPYYGEYWGISFTVPDTIEFGELIYCRDKSKTINLEMKNTSGGGVDAKLVSADITGPFTTSLAPGMDLVNGGKVAYSLTFAPPGGTPDGIVTGRMDLVFDQCDYKKTIYLTAIKSGVNMKAVKPVDFGLTDYNDRPVKPMDFINNGNTAFIFNEAVSSKPETFKIESYSKAIPVELKPGDTIAVNIKYTPGNGTETALIQAYAEQPCSFAAAGNISGISNLEPASVTIEIPEVSARTGSIIKIPVRITQQKFMWENGIRSYELFLRFNKTLLLPDGSTPRGVESGGSRIISIQGSFNTPQDISGILAEPEFRALLGNDSCTALTIDSISWNKQFVNSTLTGGSFCLSDLCKKGEAPRYFIEGSSFSIKSISSNPKENLIKIEYIANEKSPLRIHLYSITGNLVANCIKEYDGAEGSIEIQAGEFPQGIYILQLRSYTQAETRLIEVLK